MYSVLIQNQKTIQLFQEFYPVFLELFSRDKIGCCRWVESGKTIDTALPGIGELVVDKKEWRAIVIRIVELDEHDMQSHKSVPNNPYDFKENRLGRNQKIRESDIPIVRLTHILGEVPAPEVHFREEIKQEKNKAPKRVYTPEPVDKEEQRIYEDLLKKYEYDGQKPSDIILVTFTQIRKKRDKRTTTNSWRFTPEEDGFEFARRNRYSSNCRFVKYEYVKEGRNRKEADLFNFWNCVMLLASDAIDPSTFQAYRLYSARIEFNKEIMSECFQKKMDELTGCRNYVEEEIRRDVELRMGEKHPKPEYTATIKAEVNIPPNTSVSVDPRLFHLCPRSTMNEKKKWDGLKDIAEETLESIFRKQDRVLDESANRMRILSSVSEDDVTPMDKYEKLDMEAELANTFDEILKTQNTISDTRNVTSVKIRALSEDVKEYISKRIPRSMAQKLFGVLALVVMLAVIPVFIVPRNPAMGHLCAGILTMLFCLAVMWVIEVVVLVVQKNKLINKIDAYNEAMEDNLAVLTQDMKFYSKFVSNIVSFSRGRKFLEILEHKKFRLETEYELLQLHLKEIDTMYEKVVKWSKAFFIPISFSKNIGNEYIVDIDVSPKTNRLYTFEHNKEYYIPLNYTGDKVKSPFGYIDRLIIEREELFDDGGKR